MKSVYVLAVFVAVFALAQADSESDKLLKQALDNIEQGVKKFQELTGIQTEFDKSKLEKFLKDNFGKVNDKFQELIKTIEKDAKPFSEDFKKNAENIVKQFNETIKNLNTPELQGKVKNVQEALQASFKKVGEQLSELAKSAGVAPPPSIEKTLKEIYEEISKSSQKVSDKVQQIVSDAQAELKKKKPSA
ncbi:hypothetical protein [Providencia sp. PROV041]|uniref:hypothetical protein n=1 Tax=Providencia sp. PROV041 TaxID=2949772 RepID=UPI00234BB742|nr:hypothetical protein [Providencia sp. PROV041]